MSYNHHYVNLSCKMHPPRPRFVAERAEKAARYCTLRNHLPGGLGLDDCPPGQVLAARDA